ncbi:hypothetical protein BDR04DRAFT_1121418 [Suillus decipiens]|nr:hypothetical protein BDR04DRAFT_1121418 [Suillus decipiens]
MSESHLNTMSFVSSAEMVLLGKTASSSAVPVHRHASYLHYFGFYRKGQPLLPSFLQICATLEVSLQSQLSSAPMLMLHLVLIDHNITGSCFELAFEFLQPYFPNGGLEFWSVTFNIGNASKIDQYQLQVTAIVQSLMSSNWAHVIITITNHTNNEHKDPFIGYEGNKKSYISAHVHSPSFATHLFLAFAELVIIECLPIHTVFPDMLGQSYKLGCHTDVFLLMPDNSGSLAVTKFAWMHSELCSWGQYLPVQCPQCGWSNAWCSVNMHKDYIFECKNGQCRTKYYNVPLILLLDVNLIVSYAIKEYYAKSIKDKEEADEHEAASRPREPSFYKKTLSEWDVAQKLFKQEINKYDMAKQEWFNNMTPSQQQEVKFAMKKWNEEGAPEEAQAIYHKNNLKKTLEDFTEQMWCTMGCHIVMLVSHKQKASQTLSISLHKSMPQNAKKKISMSSSSIKEWTVNGFESFGEWSKTEFCMCFI